MQASVCTETKRVPLDKRAEIVTLLNADPSLSAPLIGIRRPPQLDRDREHAAESYFKQRDSCDISSRWDLYYRVDGKYCRLDDQSHSIEHEPLCQEVVFDRCPVPHIKHKRSFHGKDRKRKHSNTMDFVSPPACTREGNSETCSNQQRLSTVNKRLGSMKRSRNKFKDDIPCDQATKTDSTTNELTQWYPTGRQCPPEILRCYSTFSTEADSTRRWDHVGRFGAARFIKMIRWLSHQDQRIAINQENPDLSLIPSSLNVARSTALVAMYLTPYIPDALEWWFTIEQMLIVRTAVPVSEQTGVALRTDGTLWISEGTRARHVESPCSSKRINDPISSTRSHDCIVAHMCQMLPTDDLLKPISVWLHTLLYALAHIKVIRQAFCTENMKVMKVATRRLFEEQYWLQSTVERVEHAMRDIHAS
jgi:hypothetical protein